MSVGTGSMDHVPDMDTKLLIDLAEAEDNGTMERIVPKPYHRAIYAVTVRALQGIFTEGNYQAFYVNLGIPEDGVVVGVNFNVVLDCFEMVVEHPSFPVVKEGELLDYRRIETTIWRWKE